MNVVCAIILLYAYIISDKVWTLQQCQSLHSPTRDQFSSCLNDKISEPPLLLTPLIESQKFDEAKNKSRVVPLLDDIESYSGFLTVNKTTESNLYFWFFPNTKNVSSPLILWLQGGPGMSSLLGLFTENGPFQLTSNLTLEKRVHAWTNKYHMLYIDQPVGTGFSFTKNGEYIKTQEEVADHLYNMLIQFYQLFSELKNDDLYIAGEGYAGKFIPTIAYKIHSTPFSGIPLKGMIIGNGYTDPEYLQDFAEHYHSLGLIDKTQRVRLESKQEKIKFLVRSRKWWQAVNEVHHLYVAIGDAIDSVSMTDYTRDNVFLNFTSYPDYITQDHVRERIHVGCIEFSVISEEVHLKFLVDMMKTVRPQVETLLEYYPILFYNGQFDLLVPHRFTENFLSHLYWSGAYDYEQAERKIWRINDRVAGFIKSSGNLAHVLVRNAGSFVPLDQPKNALTLVNRFIEEGL